MENGKGEGGGDGGITEKALSAGEAEALNKCLEENKGDHSKCKAKLGAFKSSSSYQKEPSRPPPLRLPSGSFYDV
ncbi:hypothetical protein SLE2022_028290 [Rubroshorea leprosula]